MFAYCKLFCKISYFFAKINEAKNAYTKRNFAKLREIWRNKFLQTIFVAKLCVSKAWILFFGYQDYPERLFYSWKTSYPRSIYLYNVIKVWLMNSSKTSTMGANTRIMIYQLHQSKATLVKKTARRVLATRHDPSEARTNLLDKSGATLEVMKSRATVLRWEVKPLKRITKKKSLKRITISTSILQINQSISHSINQTTDHQNSNSSKQDFISPIIDDEKETRRTNTNTTGQGQDNNRGSSDLCSLTRNRIENQKESRPELRITKTEEKFNPSQGLRASRTRTCPWVLTTLIKSGSSILKTMRSAFNDACKKTP